MMEPFGSFTATVVKFAIIVLNGASSFTVRTSLLTATPRLSSNSAEGSMITDPVLWVTAATGV